MARRLSAIPRAVSMLGALFLLAFSSVVLGSGTPDSWVPARWDGGPLEAVRRSDDKALADPAIRQSVSEWYNPATLSLLEGTPVNCLLLTLSAGADPRTEKQQHQLVAAYALDARKRGIAVLGLVYPGADPSGAASAAVEAQLDGLVLEGEFPDLSKFAGQLEQELRSRDSAAVVIPLASAEYVRKAAWPVAAVVGVSPGVGEATDTATASATAGMWIDSNMWLVRSFSPHLSRRPLWISERPRSGSPEAYAKSIADAAAAGGRWIVALDDDLRARLRGGNAEAMAAWRNVGLHLRFFEDHAAWRKYAPFAKVGIVLDPAGANLAVSEECLNLVARGQIPYRVIDRTELTASSLEGLRVAIAFDLDPPSEAERKVLRDFATKGGLVFGGPSWGTPPKDQSYTVVAVGKGEIAVYKDDAPDPSSLNRDLNDLVPAEEFGVNIFNAPSVLSYASTRDVGKHMLIHFVNYAGAPAEGLSIWVAGRFTTARLYSPGAPPVDVPTRQSGGRTEIAMPELAVYGALELE